MEEILTVKKMNSWHQTMTDLVVKIMKRLSTIKVKPNMVMSFDIDDTLIDRNGKLIKPVYDLFRYVQSIGITPIIITNRSIDGQAFTREQLASFGLYEPGRWLMLRPHGMDNPYEYKTWARHKAFEKGWNVVASIGDQPWDIGKYGGIGFRVPVQPYFEKY